MCKLDQETLAIIIETRNDVKHIMAELEEGKCKFNKIESRLNRIEQFFFPVVLVISGIAHKALSWLKL